VYRAIAAGFPAALGGITAVLLPGSGLQDCNGRVAGFPFLRLLSRDLVRAGIATIRIGTRPIVYKKLPSSSDEEYTDPVGGIMSELEHNERLGDTRILVGHSQGGQMVPRLVNTLDWFSGGVMINAPALSLHDTWRKQFAASRPELRRIAMNSMSVSSIQYLERSRRYDPLVELRACRTPILAIQGGRDQQVPREDFELFRHTAEAACVDFEAHEINDIDHLCRTQVASVAAFPGRSLRISSQVAKAIVKWAKQVSRDSRRET